MHNSRKYLNGEKDTYVSCNRITANHELRFDKANSDESKQNEAQTHIEIH